jgi:RNA polymerase sigma-70 factor (ECF subfamily)
MTSMLQGFTPELTASDETLAARSRDGASSAFAVLVSRYQERIYRLVARMSGNASDAEEITQETFLRAHRGIGSFRGESLFRTWLYRIALNQALMHKRAARRRPQQSLEVVAPWGGDEDSAMAGTEPLEGADDLVDQKNLVERVRGALTQLDESHRAALVLRDLEGLSSEEAAEVLGISPNAVRQRAHRARLGLRELLREVVDAVAR